MKPSTDKNVNIWSHKYVINLNILLGKVFNEWLSSANSRVSGVDEFMYKSFVIRSVLAYVIFMKNSA